MEDQDNILFIKEWLGTGSINIFGMELSGKDTQAKILARLLDAQFLGSGDILRNSVLPERTKAALKAGKYIPQDEFVEIITPYLSKAEFANKALILSSVGRWIGEEQSVITATTTANHPIKAVIVLNISEETAYKRLSAAQRNRDDDYKEHVVSRINEFHTKTTPVIEVYRDMGLVVEVSGEKSPEEVTNAILDALYMRAKAA